MSPCLLVLEDIDTIVTSQTRSYFFNEVDGLENNDGIMMVASTNHMDRLDPGLSKRPSRFDRKYLFPLPSKEERVQYVQFWREKLRGKGKSGKVDVEFPGRLVVPMAEIMHGFSFAYMQEAFVGSLLDIAHKHDDEDEDENVSGAVDDVAGGGDDNLEKYELWRAMKEQVKMLRDEMDEEVLADAATMTAAVPPSRNFGQDVAADRENITGSCRSCSRGYCCTASNPPPATHGSLAEAPFPPPQAQALWGRPECFAFNDWTNRLQGLSLFTQDSNM
tara:strand:+ start:1937 stop:2764 length:828 start_codon:yes stop_codon:yes gene_type:complete